MCIILSPLESLEYEAFQTTSTKFRLFRGIFSRKSLLFLKACLNLLFSLFICWVLIFKFLHCITGNLKTNFSIRPNKKICMFAVTRPSLLKFTDPKLFFRKNVQKFTEDLNLFTKKSEICIFCAMYCERDDLSS